MKKAVMVLLAAALFALSLYLVIQGKKNVGPAGLITMLAGLAGLLVLLYRYNRKYQ